MKKFTITIAIVLLFSSCGTFKTVDLGKLTIGMTKEEVVYQIGQPRRVLAVNETSNGYQEVLEYKTYRSEVYALEFWNDYLSGFEFLYEDVVYTPPPAPPAIVPVYGKPLHPDYKPSKPLKPSKPSKPNPPNKPSKPNQPNRPERPGTNNQQERPNSNNNRTERPNNSGQSSTRSRQETTNSSEATRSSEERTRTRENTNTNTSRENDTNNSGRR